MIVLAIVIIIVYYYWTNRTEPLKETSKQSEADKLINKDFENYYPETPKEVVKLYANMTKVLYGGDLNDDDTHALALKIRELFSKKLQEDNDEDTYLTDLYSDLATWKDKKRTITNALIVKEDLDEENEVDGVKYVTKYISFTIQESNKFTELRKVYLKQDENKKWKIFGWEYVTEEQLDEETN
jgi:hypothetical protein